MKIKFVAALVVLKLIISCGRKQTDVYISGNEVLAEQRVQVAKYWKNGVPVQLGNGMRSSSANSIFFFDGDLYIDGGESNVNKMIAKYWENNKSVNLSDGKNNSFAS